MKDNIGLLSALSASILWGLNYVLLEKVIEKVNVFTMMFVESLVFAIIMGLLSIGFGSWRSDIHNIYEIKYTFACNIVVYMLANLLIVMSIKHSNAVVAGLIEITYPIFIIIFSYLILNKSNLDSTTVLGGIFIMIGVIIISLK
jgi:drug/metabolite transporter (DMT)-like permease